MGVFAAELMQHRTNYINQKEQNTAINIDPSIYLQQGVYDAVNPSAEIPAYFLQAEYLKQSLLNLLSYAQALVKLHNRSNDEPLPEFYLAELQILHTNIENTVFRIGVFGNLNVGKSTLINRMLGEQNLLPVDEDRCTTAYTVIQRPDKQNMAGTIQVAWHPLSDLIDALRTCLKDFNIVLPAQNGYTKKKLPKWLEKNEGKFSEIFQHLDAIDEYEIQDMEKRYLKQKAQALLKALPIHAQIQLAYHTVTVNIVTTLMRDPLAVPLIHSLTFYHDHEFLRHVQIIDSPGTGSVNLQDTFTAQQLLEHTDAILFMTDARAPFTHADEKRLLQWLTRLYDKNDIDNLFIIINKTDLSQKTIKEIQTIVQNRLKKDFKDKLKPKQVYYISVKTGEQVESFLTHFYQFLQRDKYQILLQSTLDRSSRAFLACLDELNKQVQATDGVIDHIVQNIDKTEMDKTRLSNQIGSWLMDYDHIRYTIDSKIETVLLRQFGNGIFSQEFKLNLTSAQVYIKKEQHLNQRLITICEGKIRNVIEITSEQLMLQFKADLENADRQLMFRFEKALQDNLKILKIPDLQHVSLSTKKLCSSDGTINFLNNLDFTSLIKTSLVKLAITGLFAGLSFAWIAMIIGGKSLGDTWCARLFKKSPESVADKIIQKLDYAFKHGIQNKNKNESSICSMLIANFRQEMKSKTEQIKEERQSALNNIIDSIDKDISKQYSQRVLEISKKSGLNDNEKLLRAEFEFIKSECNGLREVCN